MTDMPSKEEQFMVLVAQIRAQGNGQPNYQLYEKLKRDIGRDFAHLEHGQYERLVAACARASNI